jgi:hypothetical protein
MSVTFHRCSDGLACDQCGSLVDPTDRGRSSHQGWHDAMTVVDLTERPKEAQHSHDA